MYELTENEKTTLLTKRKVFYKTVTKSELQKDERYDRYNLTNEESSSYCWCKLNHGRKLEGNYCKYCGKHDYVTPAYPKNMVKLFNQKKKENTSSCWYNSYSDVVSLDNFFYVKEHPNRENSILIFKINISVKSPKEENDEPILDFKIDRIIEIIPNEGCRSFKYSRGKEVDIDMFNAFQLSSKLLRDGVDIEFKDSSGLIDFILKNKTFGQYTGFLECFNQVDVGLSRNAFFMFYMYIYAQYPVIEFIVKMGYIGLISDIMRDLAGGCNKESIRASANNLTKILNNEATKGSMALTVPKYIADDLNYKEAKLKEFIMWGDMCQMSPSGTISKENYEKIVYANDYFEMLNAGIFYRLPNIMKYGYTYDNIIKYIRQQSKEKDRYGSYRFSEKFNYWQDYLNMCDLMDIEFDKYPKDIVVAHNNVQQAYRAKEDELNDKKILEIAKTAEKYFPGTKEYLESEYVIMLPKKVVDIVQEGQMQHNCVGSYVRKVLGRNSLIFFIRKKDDTEHSFVTAEYAHDRLNQIFYKNNRAVHDKEILNIANTYCEKLKKDRSILN